MEKATKITTTVRLGGKFPVQYGDYNRIVPELSFDIEILPGVDPVDAITDAMATLQKGLHIVTAALAGVAIVYANVESLRDIKIACGHALTQAGVLPEASEQPIKPARKKAVRKTDGRK